MNCLKILLCDDDVNFLSFLQNQLSQIYKKHNIDCKFYTFACACEEMFENNYDICYLDIELPESSGFLLAKKINQLKPNTIIIFITALSHLALESFDYHPYDFLAKDQIHHEIERKTEALIRYIRPITYRIKIKNGYMSLLCDNIIKIEKYGNDIYITTVQKQPYRERKLLYEFQEETSDYAYFVKIHRSIIINVKHIASLNNGIIVLSDNSEFKIVRQYIRDVTMKYYDYLSRR